MTQWLHDRYISRQEHQQIVEYYRKLVGNLQHTICELKTKVDTYNLEKFDEFVEQVGREAEMERVKAQPVKRSHPLERTGNIIEYDFRNRR
jgi:DNA mismatch repair ATPase MutS